MNAATLQHSSRNVTSVIAMHHAGSVAPCRQGDKVSLHIATTEGEVLVHMSERAYCEAFRTAVDANGNPWRNLNERRIEEVAALPPPEPKVFVSRAPLKAERIKLYEEVYAISTTDHPYGAIARACRARGFTQEAFSAWRANHKGTPQSTS